MISFFFGRLFAVCLIAFGIFLMVSGHHNAKKEAALRDHGQQAQARVTDLKWKERKSTHADSQYTAQITFTTQDEREIHAEIGVPAELGREMRSQPQARVMTVRYLPEDPHTLVDVNKDDASEAQKAIGRYMLAAGLVMLVLRSLFTKRAR